MSSRYVCKVLTVPPDTSPSEEMPSVAKFSGLYQTQIYVLTYHRRRCLKAKQVMLALPEL